MRKILFDDCICHTKISNHTNIKDSILFEIENSKDNDTSVQSPYDSFSKVDWQSCTDFERPWVKLFLPSYTEALVEMMKE